MYTSNVKRALSLLLVPIVLVACGGSGTDNRIPVGATVLDFPASLAGAVPGDLSLDGATVAGIANNHAFVWNSVNGYTDLGAPKSGSTLTNVVVSGSGSTIGGTAKYSDTESRPVYSKSGAALSELDNVDAGITAITNDGSMLGGYRNISTPGSYVGVSYTTQGVILSDFPSADMDASGLLWYFSGTDGKLYNWKSSARNLAASFSSYPVTEVTTHVSGDGSHVLYVSSGTAHILKVSAATESDVTIPDGYTAASATLSYDGSQMIFPEGIYNGTAFVSVSDWLDAAGVSSTFAGWTNLTAIKLSKDNKVLLGSGKNGNGDTKYWVVRTN